jgi:hypothetical protein
MAHDFKASAKILLPANDNSGGRYIVVMQPEHIVFPEFLRERLLTGEPRWSMPTVR